MPAPPRLSVAVAGAGRAEAVLHGPESATVAVLTVGGIGNDVDGPSGAYIPIAEALAGRGVATLRMWFRQPGDLARSVADVQAGLAALRERGVEAAVLLGWSFGGAVVLRAAEGEPMVCGVATVATQGAGVADVSRLAPRHLLFAHGTDDPVLPSLISVSLHAQAFEPKRLLLYEGDGHCLEAGHERFVGDFLEWCDGVLPRGPA